MLTRRLFSVNISADVRRDSVDAKSFVFLYGDRYCTLFALFIKYIMVYSTMNLNNSTMNPGDTPIVYFYPQCDVL